MITDANSNEPPTEPDEIDPESDRSDALEPEPELPIELAPPPPSELEARPATIEPVQTDPGQAPSDGAGSLVAGAVLIPGAALLLLLRSRDSEHTPISTITVGAGVGLIGAGLIGVGSYRRYKLNRWARVRGVIPQSQGAGLLALGGLAAGFGVSMIGGGIAMLANSHKDIPGSIMIGAGATLGAISVAPLVIGTRRRAEYQRTGGWIRRPLTHIEIAPRLLVGRDRVELGVVGRF